MFCFSKYSQGALQALKKTAHSTWLQSNVAWKPPPDLGRSQTSEPEDASWSFGAQFLHLKKPQISEYS